MLAIVRPRGVRDVVDGERANATGTSVDSDHGHEVVSVV